jgi:hypothetical protein
VVVLGVQEKAFPGQEVKEVNPPGQVLPKSPYKARSKKSRKKENECSASSSNS